MKDDPYILNSSKTRRMEEKTFYHSKWNDFLKAIRYIDKNKNKMPNERIKTILLDINCWLLLFYGYENMRTDDTRLGENIVKEIRCSIDEPLFSHNVKRLFTIFYFELKSFYEVWEYQRDLVGLLSQIIQEKFFIGNKFAERKKRIWRPEYELICYPNKYAQIQVPRLNRILDGLLFPVVVSKNNHNYRAERLETTNFGDGDFITCDGQVIDCIRVNDFWQTRNHLKQRLAFSFLVESDYDEAPMIICNNMKDIELAWCVLGANSSDGVLIRSLGENLYQNYWLILNKDSAFIPKRINSLPFLTGKNDNEFVTLEGKKIGNLGYNNLVLHKINWLDDFDIRRFYDIVF